MVDLRSSLPRRRFARLALVCLAFLTLAVGVRAASAPIHANDSCPTCQVPTTDGNATESAGLFDTSGFPPRWQCGEWSQSLGWLHIVSDLLIWASYLAIPLALLWVVRSRSDLPFTGVFWLFIAFILSCGTVHLLEAALFWWPAYRLSGVLKLATALVSVATVVALFPVLPAALRLRSPRQLEELIEQRTREIAQSNATLRAEVEERKRVEAQLLATAGRFRAVFEQSAVGMLLVDGSGAIQRANPVAEHMLGFADGELSGIQVDTLVPESVRPAHAQNRAGYMQKPENRHMGEGRELFAVRKDGTQLPVEIALSPANDESEPMVLCSIVDIELRKQAQDGLSSYADRLKRSNEELEQFAYVVSHDIKAPLRGIASVSEWIAEDLADSASAETKENLALLLDRTERLAALIDGILRYSRVGRLESTRHPVDVGQLLQDVRDSLDPPKSIEVRLHGPFPTVTYDATQLRQVFQNLIDNAIKHMDREAGHIDVTCVEGPVYWTFGVKDDGPGIPERHFERIFGLFQTLKPKDDTRSVGLGLAISKRIVTLNGGTIHVQSEVDAGSEFSFTVPRDLTGKPKKPQRVSTS